MASFALEEFLGEGTLKDLMHKLIEAGWDDVPMIKMMNSEDMELIKFNQQQKNALELRIYLHDRALMEYAEKLEASNKSLTELLGLTTVVLSSQFSMKRGHVARFIDRTRTCRISMPPNYTLPARQRNYSRSVTPRTMQMFRSISKDEISLDQSVFESKIREGYVFKGMVAAGPAEPRLCGCIQPPLASFVDFARRFSMGLLDKLWDDTVAGPQPDTGLSKLRKPASFSIRSISGKEEQVDEPRVTRSIMIKKPAGSPSTGNGTPPTSPAGSTPPVSPFSGGKQWNRFRRKSSSDAYERGAVVDVGPRNPPPHEN